MGWDRDLKGHLAYEEGDFYLSGADERDHGRGLITRTQLEVSAKRILNLILKLD